MYVAFKWIMDRILALLALVILFPLLLILAIAVAVDSPGGPFIVQKREGYKKKTIKVLKFRTMRVKTEEEETVADDTVEHEEKRVTRVGQFLRRSKLDELPQLWNVLKGDMSFVGPRPLITYYENGVELPHRRDRGTPLAVRYKQYEYWEFRKFAVLPGMTGLPQVMGNCFLSAEERSYYDVLYTEKQSLWTDFRILLRTIGVIFRGEKPYRKAPTREKIDALINRYQSPKGVTRIAEVLGNAKIGGVKSVLINYLDHMDLTGLDIHIFTYGPSDVDPFFHEKGWTVHYLPNFIRFPFAKRAFRKELCAQKYDVVHSHLTSLSVFPLKVAKEQGVDVRICHAHSTTSHKEKVSVVKNFLARFAAKYATDLLACGNLSAEWLYGERAKSAVILRNAIDLDKFAYNEEARKEGREKLCVAKDTLLVGCIARFEVQKNLGCLIDAVAAARKERDVKLLLVGEGHLRKKLEKRARKAGIADSVIFTGKTEEPWSYYSVMDVFALPSLYEGLPVVAIEAQAAGLPCLFSDAITRECAVAENVIYLPAKSEDFKKAILSLPLDRTDNVEALRAAGYDIREQAPLLRKYYDGMLRDSFERLHSRKRTVWIGKKKRTFYVASYAPWQLITAILATDFPAEKYFTEDDRFRFRDLIEDFRDNRPDEYDEIVRMTEMKK